MPTYHHWTVHLPIDTRTPAVFAEKLEHRIARFKTKFTDELSQYRQKAQDGLIDTLWNKFLKESKLLDKEMTTTRSVLAHFGKSKSRSKRSLLPFVGDALETLFGTVTSKDLDEVLSRVNDLSDAQGGILSVVDNAVTLINQTVVDVTNNRQTLNRLINATYGLTNTMRYLRGTIIDEYTVSTLNVRLDSVFIDLSAAVRDFREEILGLETIIGLAENGILSRALLPPNQFTTVLHDIQKILPRELTLPFNPTEISKYYANVHSKVVRNDTNISVILTVPLLYVKDRFTVYQVFNVPVPKIGSDQTLMANYEIPEIEFIALSDDSLKYVLVDDRDLHVYLRRRLPFCPLRQPILNVQTSTECITALLTNQTDKIPVNCDKTVRVQTTDPTAQYLGNGHWLVISTVPIDLDIRCKNGLREKHSMRVSTVPPLFIVKLDLGCGAFSEYFQLPVFFQKDSFLEPYQIHYLNLTLHTADVWAHIHADLKLHNLTIESSLKMLPPSQSKSVSVSLLKAHIKSLQKRAHWHYTVTVPSVTTIAFILIFMAIALYIWKRRCSNQSPSIPSAPAPNPPSPGSLHVDTTDRHQDRLDLTRPEPQQDSPWLTKSPRT